MKIRRCSENRVRLNTTGFESLGNRLSFVVQRDELASKQS